MKYLRTFKKAAKQGFLLGLPSGFCLIYMAEFFETSVGVAFVFMMFGVAVSDIARKYFP